MWEAIAIDRESGEIIESRNNLSFAEMCVYGMTTESQEIEVKAKESV